MRGQKYSQNQKKNLTKKIISLNFKRLATEPSTSDVSKNTYIYKKNNNKSIDVMTNQMELKRDNRGLSINKIRMRFSQIVAKSPSINSQEGTEKVCQTKNQRLKYISFKEGIQKSEIKAKQLISKHFNDQQKVKNYHPKLNRRIVEQLAKQVNLSYSYSQLVDRKEEGQNQKDSKQSIRQGCNPYSLMLDEEISRISRIKQQTDKKIQIIQETIKAKIKSIQKQKELGQQNDQQNCIQRFNSHRYISYQPRLSEQQKQTKIFIRNNQDSYHPYVTRNILMLNDQYQPFSKHQKKKQQKYIRKLQCSKYCKKSTTHNKKFLKSRQTYYFGQNSFNSPTIYNPHRNCYCQITNQPKFITHQYQGNSLQGIRSQKQQIKRDVYDLETLEPWNKQKQQQVDNIHHEDIFTR